MKRIKNISICLFIALTMSSCYSYNTFVGTGGKGQEASSQWNHYILFGLVPVGISNPKMMAGDAQDYQVNTKQTFVNGLVSGLTFGIYTPTKTTIYK